ncbi:MAG: ABC transporter permease [Saprospiraceae bacterium]|nr:ABC transporter permease [Saprospiraceae bacterium]
MLIYHLKIAARNLSKQKMYTAIKVGGFALGVAACTLIALFIRHELSFDTHYKNGENLYRVVGINRNEGIVDRGVNFPAPFAPALKAELAEIEMIGRINPNTLFTGGGNPLRRMNETENHYEEGFTFADPQMIDLLEIPMIYGHSASALKQPNSIVISKKICDKYFPGENPVGQTLIFNDNAREPVLISGVMQDFPNNSHLDFDFLISQSGLEFYPGEQTNWNASNYHTYLRLRPGTDVEQFEEKMMATVFDKYLIDVFKKEGMDAAAIEKIRQSIGLELQPISKIHLHSSGIADGFMHGDTRMVWLFGTIAFFILVIACINFINLSTARSAERAREVGVRKALGSQRSDLVRQFLTETVLLSAGAFVLGLFLARIALPFFNQLADKSLTIPWEELWFLPLFAGTALLVGLLAGLYPAFYMGSFQLVHVLKGSGHRGNKSVPLRSSLVVFQFAASTVLIIGAIVVLKQTDFILNTQLGFDKEQVLLLQGTQNLGDKTPVFKQELRRISSVENVSISDYLPISGGGSKRNGNTFWEVGKDKNSDFVTFQMWTVDHNYIQTLGMDLVEGRDFSPEMPSDSQAVIINETLARKLNFEQPVGKRITNDFSTYTVIGVVKDFHFESFRENIGGVCLALGNSPGITAVKVKTSDMPQTIEAVTRAWQKISPNQAIRYTFLDEGYARMYDDVLKQGRIFGSFAVFAILIACLGLFALATYMAEQRTKEIGIRKVLGASVTSISNLLVRDFVKLVFIAIVIASPIAYYFMQKWLSDFAYHIDLQWWMFAAAGLIALAIAFLTVGFQSVKAALANPVKSLRS